MLLKLLTDPQAAAERLDQIEARTTGAGMDQARQTVDLVLEAVRQRGDSALREFTAQFDRVQLEQLRVPKEAIDAAWELASPELKDALTLAYRRISSFHREQIPHDISLTGPHGEKLGRRWRPVERAGAPRFLFSDVPLGNAAGLPHDRASQDLVLEMALRVAVAQVGVAADEQQVGHEGQAFGGEVQDGVAAGVSA